MSQNYTNCPNGYRNTIPDKDGKCYAGWDWNFQEGDARRECANSRGTWIPLNYWFNPYTCKMPPKEISEPPMAYTNDLDSKPDTIAIHTNYIKDYIYEAGYNENTRCRDVLLGKNLEKLPDYIVKIGDYNFKEASNPVFTPEQVTYFSDFNARCPDKWETIGHDCYAPGDYKGPCPTGRIGNCPQGATKAPDNCNICIFSDPACDESCKRQRCMNANGSYSKNNCYLRRQDIPNFKDSSDADKANWERKCNVQWPQVPNRKAASWSCTYGESINQKNIIVRLGEAGSPFEAAKLVLSKRNPYDNSVFFALSEGNVYVSKDGTPDPFTSNGEFDSRCSQAYPKVELFRFSQDLLNKAKECASLNSNINLVNDSTFMNPSVIREGFVNYDLIENMDNNLNQTQVFNAIKESGGAGWSERYKKMNYADANRKIQNNLNEIVQNLSKNYNANASIYNKQTDIVNLHQDLADSKAQKLNKQLDNLYEIQNQIALKGRIIELNEEEADLKLRHKKMIVGIVVLIPFLLIPIVMVSTGLAPGYVGFTLVIIILIFFAVYMYSIYRQHSKLNFKKIKDDIKSTYDVNVQKVRDRIINEYNEARGDCICPEEGVNLQEECLKKFYSMNLQTMTLAQFQELMNCIGCSRALTDKDVEKLRNVNMDMRGFITYLKNAYIGARKCDGSQEFKEFQELCIPGFCEKSDFLLKANAGYKYNDGSAPTSQIFPKPLGKFDINVENQNIAFPEQVADKIAKIENPLKRLFFILWIMELTKHGFSLDDPRLKTRLNIVELEIAGNAPEPYWNEIKLPLLRNMDNTIKEACLKYNSMRKDLGEGIGKFLVDTWYYLFNENIPTDVYQKWLPMLNRASNDETDLTDYYMEFLKEAMQDKRFSQKYGDINKFLDEKLKEMMNTIDGAYEFSDDDVERI